MGLEGKYFRENREIKEIKEVTKEYKEKCDEINSKYDKEILSIQDTWGKDNEWERYLIELAEIKSQNEIDVVKDKDTTIGKNKSLDSFREYKKETHNYADNIVNNGKNDPKNNVNDEENKAAPCANVNNVDQRDRLLEKLKSLLNTDEEIQKSSDSNDLSRKEKLKLDIDLEKLQEEFDKI
jgi:hypothetical protein